MNKNTSVTAIKRQVVNTGSLKIGKRSMAYHSYIPKQIKHDKILVLVHGISRNSRDMINYFINFSDLNNVVIIAPVFDSENCSDYQRLGRFGKGPRADFMLQCILEKVTEELNIPHYKLLMVGNSGGAQFVHRYAYAYPQQVAKAALVAPGWYTFPKNLPFPYGLNWITELPDLKFKIKRVLSVPFKVFVGDKDTMMDDSLNQTKSVSWQGKNRVIRANKWVQSMHNAAKRHSMQIDISLEVLAEGKHEFHQMITETNLLKSLNHWLVQ